MSGAPDMKGTWFHCISTTYGAWLYGDARGFRTRHHREHIVGDYRSPPPIEKYAPSARPASVPPTESAPSLLMMVKLVPRAGVKPSEA